MKNIEVILDYYVLTSKLKDTIRSGWKLWNIQKERLESVAEHVFGTCMLAIAIWSETLPPVNLAEVLMTLAIHETEEILIGDLTPFDEGYKDKKQAGKKAVQSIFKNFVAKEVFCTLIQNFDNQSTPEAVFAFKCDKLECDLQAKLYDEKGYASFEKASPIVKNDARIKKLSEKGLKKVSMFFIAHDRKHFAEDENDDIFFQISKYIEKNNILKVN